jgi:hypothetical protein
VVARQVVAELADRLEERQASMSPTVPPISHQHEIVVVVAFEHEILDLVGDVRDHLHGGAEILAACAPSREVRIDAARGDVVALGWPSVR